MVRSIIDPEGSSSVRCGEALEEAGGPDRGRKRGRIEAETQEKQTKNKFPFFVSDLSGDDF